MSNKIENIIFKQINSPAGPGVVPGACLFADEPTGELNNRAHYV
jgi:hypothetical protein